MSINIRIAKDENDSLAASVIYAKSWRVAYRGVFGDRLMDELPLDNWVTMFNSNYTTHRFAVAIYSVAGRDIGAGAYGLSRDYDDASIGEVTSLYFLEEAWGKGYSGQLMDFMLERLREMGCNSVNVWTLSVNHRAQHFYEKRGFKRTGKTQNVDYKGIGAINVEFLYTFQQGT